jgi:TolB protein
MRTRRVALVGCLVAGSLVAARPFTGNGVAAAPFVQQTDVTIDMPTGGKPPRLAIPAAVGAGTDTELAAAAGVVMTTLWADLNFEEEFDLVSRDAVAKVPVADTIDTLAYDRLAELGADFVVFSRVARVEAGFKLELQLVGVRAAAAKKVGFSASYASCTIQNPRACAHVVADDLHKRVRHLDGLAQTRLAFTSDRDQERMTGRFVGSGQGKEIYIADYDGENQRRITANQSLNLAPSWGPDGRTLAYVSYVFQSPDIFVRDVFEARLPTRPAAGTTQMENTLPAFSPDGSRIAFSSTRAGNWDIWVVNRDGSGLRNLTNNSVGSVINNSPTWSPTGVQIAFTSNRTGSNQIYVMSAEGTGLEKLTSDPGVDRPTWSPAPYNDIAYTSGVQAGHDINLFDVGTRQVRVLTSGLGDNGSPTFAPNGRHIAFVTSRWGRDQIAIIDRKGNIQLKVTAQGANTYPNWSRTPRQ